MIQRKGGESLKKLFHDQSQGKYGTEPGSNSQPLNLESDSHLLPDTLTTALCGLVYRIGNYCVKAILDFFAQ